MSKIIKGFIAVVGIVVFLFVLSGTTSAVLGAVFSLPIPSQLQAVVLFAILAAFLGSLFSGKRWLVIAFFTASRRRLGIFTASCLSDSLLDCSNWGFASRIFLFLT